MNRLTLVSIVALAFCACPSGPASGDSGTSPPRDSGMVMSQRDGGPSPADSGTVADAGMTAADSGSGPAADGGNVIDSGTTVTDAGPGRLSGHAATFYWALPNQIRIADPDPAGHISVLVPSADGGFLVLAARNTGDGGFQVAGVPAGDVIVRDTVAAGVAPNFVVTSARDLDFDQYTLGRPGLAEDPQFQSISITATGLEPATDPTFVLTGANTGFYGELGLSSSFSSPVTSISNETATFNFSLGARPDGTAGDTVYLVQTADIDAGVPTSVATGIVRGAALAGSPALSDGSPVSAQLMSQPAASSAMRINQASYLARASEVVGTASRTPVIYFAANPSPRAAGMPDLWVNGYTGELESFYANATMSDLSFNTSYVDVYPSAWGRVASVQLSVSQSVQVPGGTPMSFSAYLSDSKALSSSVDFSLRISPPAAVKIDGQPATTAGTLGSLTPTLSWSAPAVGTPQVYQVRIYTLLVNGSGATRRELAANLMTKGLSLKVPPGVLSSGSYSVFIVEAYLESPTRVFDHPYWGFQAFDLAVAQSASARWVAP